MEIENYLQTLTEPIGKRTLCFLIDEQTNRVLLGKKKRGFGEGNYLGIGGKVEEGESIEGAVIREFEEETNVTPINLQKMAVVTFLFPNKPPSWNQEVHVYFAHSWKGKPTETDEISPEWFNIDKVPYGLMWDDNKYWLPKILNGDKLKWRCLFNSDLKVSHSDFLPYAD